MDVLKSPLQMWRQLQMDAGLELRRKGGIPGRDADIEEALRAALDIPTAAASLDVWLADDAASSTPRVTIEDLLVAVLTSQRGYSAMMGDILDLLVIAKARRDDHVLSVQFRFDEVSDPIRFTLEAFRQEIARAGRVLVSRFELPPAAYLWDLRGKLHAIVPNLPHDRPAGFLPVCDPPITGDQFLDESLNAITELVSEFRAWCAAFGASRTEVFSAVSRNQSGTPDPLQDALVMRAGAATDFWDVTTLNSVHEIAKQIIGGALNADNVLSKLAPLLGAMVSKQHWITRTYTELLDLLNLPAWRRRHELYSVWAGSVLLRTAVAEADNIHFHVVDGVLSFAFGGSRLATYDRGGEQFDIWAELRSALVGQSKKRKRGIQPDFRVLRASIGSSANAATRLVLECKHYLTASTSNFTQAAADYARSCPTAFILVVNNGPANPAALLESVDKPLQDRIGFIGDATANVERISAPLGSAIQQVLFPKQMQPQTSPASTGGPSTVSSSVRPSDMVATIRLRWDDSLEDIDLALEIFDSNGQAKRIDFSMLGDLAYLPFARLEKDVRRGPGEERIDISAWHFNRYALVATNYSKTGRLGPENLACTITIGSEATVLNCPILGSATEWRIAIIDVVSGVDDKATARLSPCH